MAVTLFIDIENSAGQKQGNGPIISALRWRILARMDRAGAFEFEMPASDPKSFAVQKKRIARAYAIVGGQRVEVGAGIIDRIQKQPQPDGKVVLRVSGDDLVRELTYRSVLNLKLYSGGNPVSHAASVAAVAGYAPAGWTIIPDSSPPNDSVYGYFNGETVLAGCIKVADKSQNHFYRGTGRTLNFASSFTPSGIRAIQAKGSLSPATCAIISLTEQIDTYDLITRIYPRGSGNANVQLTLRATNRVAPAGYTLNAAQNYIEHDASVANYGVIERQVDFRDIGPIDNTDADIVAASNALFDAAIETLRRQSTELEQATYALQVAGCSQLLRPMQSIRLVYRDVTAGLNINADLNILEATWEVSADAIQTTGLVVSNADRWPRSDVGTLVDGIEQGQVYQALQQLSANSYTIAHTKHVDDTETATIDLDLGDEVTQVHQVLLRFRLKPFESTVKSVGGESSGSGDIPTSGPSTNSTGTGGNNETGSGGTTATDSSTPTIGSTTPAIGSTTPDIGSTTPAIGSTTPDIGSATPTIGLESPTIGGATPTIGEATITTNNSTPTIGGTALTSNTITPTIGSTTPTIGSTGLTTNTPTGGSTDGSGHHQHAVNVIAGSGNLGAVSLHQTGGLYFFANPFVTGSEPVYTTPIGFHTHTINSHVHTINPHTHTVASHTHTISPHTHTIAEHTHLLNTHTHTINSHGHTIALHSHTIAAHAHTIASHTHTIATHTHTIAAHTHTIAAHTHTIAAHTHTITAHTHSMAQHTHSLNNHSHNLSESIVAIYGIFREDVANTYGINDLEYRVNVGGWIDLNTATPMSGSRFELDITSQIVNSATLRQSQNFNTIDFRRKAAAAADKTVMLDVQMKIRTVIQAVALV